jgi:hypothetical protein
MCIVESSIIAFWCDWSQLLAIGIEWRVSCGHFVEVGLGILRIGICKVGILGIGIGILKVGILKVGICHLLMTFVIHVMAPLDVDP